MNQIGVFEIGSVRVGVLRVCANHISEHIFGQFPKACPEIIVKLMRRRPEFHYDLR